MTHPEPPQRPLGDRGGDLQALRSRLQDLVRATDVPLLCQCLNGKHLPVLGGDLHPAEVLHRALSLPPYRPQLAARLAAMTARLCDQAARSMDETLDALHRAATEIGQAVTAEWEDFRCGERYLFSLFLLASYLPAEATLGRALATLHRVARRAGNLLGGTTRAGRQLRRALICQQTDDRLEGLWLNLIERVERRTEGRLGNRLTAEQKSDLLDAWSGLLWIPPSPAERESGATLSLERAIAGLLALHRATFETPDSVPVLRYALRRLSEAYPRSPEFWFDRLAPRLSEWPQLLQAVALEQWPLLAAEALDLTALVPAEAADVWQVLTASERESIAQSAAVGNRGTWRELWHRLLRSRPRPDLAPRRWHPGLAKIQQALEDRFPALAPELEEPVAEEPRAAAPPESPPPALPAERPPAPPNRRRVGDAYQVSLLSIEIAESDAFAAARQSDPEGFETLCRTFRHLVDGIAATYGGECLFWNQAGGVMIFWAARSFDHAIMTGLKVLHNLPLFHLDPAQNPLSIPIRTRAAAHDAVVIFQLPLSSIRSTDADFVVELQRHYTDPAELTVPRRLYDRVDNRLKEHLQLKGRFANEPIFACRLPASEHLPDERSLEHFTRRLKLQAAPVREALETPAAALEMSALESMSTQVDGIYSELNQFCSAFSQEDTEWPRELYARLAAAAADLARREAETWTALRKSYIGGKYSAAKADKLEAIVRAASRRRSRPVVILEKLKQRFRQKAETEVEGPARRTAVRRTAEPGTAEPGTAEVAAIRGVVDDRLTGKLRSFIRADALDSVTLLTELLLNLRNGFLEFLRAGGSDERHAPLLTKLWETADLVLLDDLDSIGGPQRVNGEKVIDTLISGEVADGRFRLVHQLLASAEEPQEGMVYDALWRNGWRTSEEDLQIVWRCLVLGHSSDDLRHSVVWKLTPDSMLQAIAHPSIPIASIHAIGERINKAGPEDTKKIFFDCIRAPLEYAIERFDDGWGISSLTRVILLLLDYPFLVESGYFERFDDLLGKFLERANQAGLKVEYFENLRLTLDRAHRGSHRRASGPPAGLKQLPLTIQRRLAGESSYLYWFVAHPDPRIAGETLRHVGLANIERVLRLKEVNQAVFAALLRKRELFTRPRAQLAALHHPKCDQRFASRYLGTLTRSPAGLRELSKIAADPSANPMVRRAARRAVAATGRPAGSRRV